MLRYIRNLKSSAWRDIPKSCCSYLARSDRSDVQLTLPTVVPSEFASRICPLAVPALIEKLSHRVPCGPMLSPTNLLCNKPQPKTVPIPEEINLHRAVVLEDLNTYIKAKSAFKAPYRKQQVFAHVLVVAGAESTKGCPFYQSSEFQYLCDCSRPQSALVLYRSRKKKTWAILFIFEEVDSQVAAVLTGMHHVDEVLPLTRLKERLAMLLKDSPKLWHTLERSNAVSRLVNEVAEISQTPVNNPRYIMEHTRSVKTARELGAIRQANTIAAESMAAVIARQMSQRHHHKLQPQDLITLFDFKCRRHYGHPDKSFKAKVMGGYSDTALWHMEAGCQYEGYQGGLARTWPGSGRFTPPQKLLYDALLDMHRDLCELIQCGDAGGPVRTPLDIHAAYLILLARYLEKLHVLPKTLRSPKETVKAAANYNCSPVVVCHVGLDPCETSHQLLKCPLVPGNVISLNLSISIPDNCFQAYPEFRGVFCQLGNTLHIGENCKVEVLTVQCPVKYNFSSSENLNVKELKII